jgi:N-succinyl-L-ornithine transcarbamylase
MRTRISTQAAAQNLGLQSIVFHIDKEGWAMEFAEGAVMDGTTVEHIKDAAPVLGEYFDILCVRTFPLLRNREYDYSEEVLQQFIRHTGIPVVSMESATLHPLQSLADIVTITEHKTVHRPKVVLSWAPHIKPLPQCVANSFAEWMNAWGEADFVIAHPEGYELDHRFSGGATITHNQREALQEADFVYVKNWSSFSDYGRMPAVPDDWMLTQERLSVTNKARIMHCLPVRRNVELGDDVLDSPYSIVTQQAGNRVWSAQAVLAHLLKAMK